MSAMLLDINFSSFLRCYKLRKLIFALVFFLFSNEYKAGNYGSLNLNLEIKFLLVDFSMAEASLIPDMLVIMSQRINMTSSVDAEHVVNSLSRVLQGLVFNKHVWVSCRCHVLLVFHC